MALFVSTTLFCRTCQKQEPFYGMIYPEALMTGRTMEPACCKARNVLQSIFYWSDHYPNTSWAFDQLVGKNKWKPCMSMGTFSGSLPLSSWPRRYRLRHVDASFPGNDPSMNYFAARINVRSKAEALLILFLFSDVTEIDAYKDPTGIHLDILPDY